MLKGTIYISFARIVFIGSSYLIHIIAARYLGIENYGIMGLMIGLMEIIRLFSNYGLPQSISRYVSSSSSNDEEQEVYKSGIVITFIGSLILGLIYYLNSKNIAIFFKDESLTQLIEVSALIIPSMALFQIFQAYLNGKKQFKKQSYGIIVYVIGRLMLFMVFILLGYEVMGVVISFVIASYIAMIFSKKMSPNPMGRKSFSKKTILKSATPILISSIGLVLILNIDLLMVKRIDINDLSLGYYTASGTLAKVPYMIFYSFAMTFFPTVSGLHLHKNKMKMVIEKGMKQLFIVIIPSVILISGFSSGIINLIYSEEYLTATSSLSILVIGLGALCIYGSIMNIFNATSPKYAVIFSLLGVLIQIPLCYLLIMKYSILGAAIGTTIASFVIMIVGIIFLNIRFQVKLGWPIYLKYIFVGLLMYLFELEFVNIIGSNNIIKLSTGILSAIILYIIMMLLVGIIKKQDLKLILLSIQSKTHFKF